MDAFPPSLNRYNRRPLDDLLTVNSLKMFKSIGISGTLYESLYSLIKNDKIMNKKNFSSLLLCAVLCLIGQSSQATADLTFYYSGGDDYVVPGDYPIEFTLHNSGDEFVTSFTLNWSVNGGATQSHEFTNVFFPNNENLMDFEVPGEIIDVNAEDTYDISFWISEINDITQSLSTNNQTARTVHRLDAIPEHKVLAEKITATWCPNCPAAAVVMENIQDDFPDNLLLSYMHKSDAYEPPHFDEINAFYGGLPQPSGFVDRYVFPVTNTCLLYTSPSPRDATLSRMPSSA